MGWLVDPLVDWTGWWFETAVCFSANWDGWLINYYYFYVFFRGCNRPPVNQAHNSVDKDFSMDLRLLDNGHPTPV